MTKIVFLIALVCVAIASARRFGLNGKFNLNRRPDAGILWSSKLCDNANLTQSFLIQIQAFITTLETNNSFTEFLEDHTHTVAYIKNNSTAVLLSSNCTEYFNGFNNARKLDKQAEEQQASYDDIANLLYKRILQSLLGIRSLIDDKF